MTNKDADGGTGRQVVRGERGSGESCTRIEYVLMSDKNLEAAHDLCERS